MCCSRSVICTSSWWLWIHLGCRSLGEWTQVASTALLQETGAAKGSCTGDASPMLSTPEPTAPCPHRPRSRSPTATALDTPHQSFQAGSETAPSNSAALSWLQVWTNLSSPGQRWALTCRAGGCPGLAGPEVSLAQHRDKATWSWGWFCCSSPCVHSQPHTHAHAVLLALLRSLPAQSDPP